MQVMLRVLPGPSGRPWNNEQLCLQEVKVVNRKRNSSNCTASIVVDFQIKVSHLTKPNLIPKLSIQPSLATLTTGEENPHEIPGASIT